MFVKKELYLTSESSYSVTYSVVFQLRVGHQFVQEKTYPTSKFYLSVALLAVTLKVAPTVPYLL